MRAVSTYNIFFFKFYLSCKVLKEAPSGALVELRHRVPQHPEDDGLRRGEDQRQQPSHHHHQPGCQHYELSSTSSNPIFSSFKEYLALFRCLAVFRQDKGLLMLTNLK